MQVVRLTLKGAVQLDGIMSTYTYVLLDVSESTYEEIRGKLEAAGYGHVFHHNPDAPASPRIDMHGIALVPEIDMTPEIENPQ